MSNYLVRVELHHHATGDYDTLHAAMLAAGFQRTITGADGTVYHLPTAEYYCTSDLKYDRVLKIAQEAAQKTRKSFGVLVAETSICTWIGLTPVR